MRKIVQALNHNRNKLIMAGVVTASGAGLASAQTTGDSGVSINYPALINPVTSGMVSSVNASGPLLFGFVAVIGGFYFVWGRIRSLW